MELVYANVTLLDDILYFIPTPERLTEIIVVNFYLGVFCIILAIGVLLVLERKVGSAKKYILDAIERERKEGGEAYSAYMNETDDRLYEREEDYRIQTIEIPRYTFLDVVKNSENNNNR